MKKTFLVLLTLIMMVSVIDTASAQRRKRKKRRVKQEDTRVTRSEGQEDEETSIWDMLNSEIKIGNINFFGNQLTLSGKVNSGYKFNNIFSAGLGAKLFYDFINYVGDNDISYFRYGGHVYGRAKLGSQFYVQGEYNVLRVGSINTTPAKTITYPSAGIGYIQPGDRWSYGVELMVPLDGEARDNIGIVEYWINFSYNF